MQNSTKLSPRVVTVGQSDPTIYDTQSMLVTPALLYSPSTIGMIEHGSKVFPEILSSDWRLVWESSLLAAGTGVVNSAIAAIVR